MKIALVVAALTIPLAAQAMNAEGMGVICGNGPRALECQIEPTTPGIATILGGMTDADPSGYVGLSRVLRSKGYTVSRIPFPAGHKPSFVCLLDDANMIANCDLW